MTDHEFQEKRMAMLNADLSDIPPCDVQFWTTVREVKRYLSIGLGEGLERYKVDPERNLRQIREWIQVLEGDRICAYKTNTGIINIEAENGTYILKVRSQHTLESEIEIWRGRSKVELQHKALQLESYLQNCDAWLSKRIANNEVRYKRFYS